jgi:hypothetical protein
MVAMATLTLFINGQHTASAHSIQQSYCPVLSIFNINSVESERYSKYLEF